MTKRDRIKMYEAMIMRIETEAAQQILEVRAEIADLQAEIEGENRLPRESDESNVYLLWPERS